MPPLDVALITSAKSGLTQFIHRDVSALVERGVRVRLFMIFNRPGLYPPRADWDVTEASKVKAAWALAALTARRPGLMFRLVRHARRNGVLKDLALAAQWSPRIADADVIFAYFGDHKLFVAYYCKLITGRPLTVTIRAYELYRNPNPELFVEALGACDRVLTITEFNKDQLVRRFDVPADKIQIVRQIVDLELYRDRPVTKILAVGFFAEKKGYDVLLRAYRDLDRDDVELWIVGDWTPSVLSIDVRQLAKELGVSERVAFFGAQSGASLRALYRECDIFCLASRTDRLGDKEGFPNVVAEAMAFGKPVVSTRHAGIPEAIREIVVDEDDASQLTEALRRTIDDPELRSRLGTENRGRAEEMFSQRNNEDLARALHETADVVAPRSRATTKDQGSA